MYYCHMISSIILYILVLYVVLHILVTLLEVFFREIVVNRNQKNSIFHSGNMKLAPLIMIKIRVCIFDYRK